jgi:hypothetical protein
LCLCRGNCKSEGGKQEEVEELDEQDSLLQSLTFGADVQVRDRVSSIVPCLRRRHQFDPHTPHAMIHNDTALIKKCTHVSLCMACPQAGQQGQELSDKDLDRIIDRKRPPHEGDNSILKARRTYHTTHIHVHTH